MKKKVLVISTSFRQQSNSEILADKFMEGAAIAGHSVEKIALCDHLFHFCKGCLACQTSKTGHCVVQDDADIIIEKMAQSDVIVFATSIYFYEMSGQMKALLDRTNPLYPINYNFREIYLVTAAAEAETSVMDGAVKGLQGWIDCFEKAVLKGVIYGTGMDMAGVAKTYDSALEKAYEMGKTI